MPGRLGRREQSVRVIDVFVDELDLADFGFDGVAPEATGRPSYRPSVLLKLYIYGYLNRVQSNRRLEREDGRNVEVMWLMGRLAPDHKTIAEPRRDNGRAKLDTWFYLGGVKYCYSLELVEIGAVPPGPRERAHQANDDGRQISV